MSAYARKTDFDKLTNQLEKFVEKLNELIVTKELHAAAQSIISEKLEKIESLIEKQQGKTEMRLGELEKNEIKQRTLRKFIYAQGAILFSLCAGHWKPISDVFLFLMKN